MTLDDPKRCPFCLDDEVVTRSSRQGKHWVECDTCDACGPIFDTLPEAVQAWNVVHRASAQETSVEGAAPPTGILTRVQERAQQLDAAAETGNLNHYIATVERLIEEDEQREQF